MDLHGDHTSTCTAHSGATKAHDWMVGALWPLFRTAGHTVRTQNGVTASAGQRHGDVEIRIPPRPSGQPEPGLRPVHHARPLWAHRETEAHFTVTESSTNKQHHLSSLSAGMSSQCNQSDSFRFKRAAFYQSLKDSLRPKLRR